jgi:hypothetical protein
MGFSTAWLNLSFQFQSTSSTAPRLGILPLLTLASPDAIHIELLSSSTKYGNDKVFIAVSRCSNSF